MRVVGFLVCAVALAAVPTGPEPGQAVPDFRLQDQKGAYQTLRSIMGPRGAMLVFYRSADW
jgi:peroxiredoxin